MIFYIKHGFPNRDTVIAGGRRVTVRWMRSCSGQNGGSGLEVDIAVSPDGRS